MVYVGKWGTITIDLPGKYLQAWLACGCRFTLAVGERKSAVLEATIAVPVYPCLHGYRLSVMYLPALGLVADAWVDPPFSFDLHRLPSLPAH